MGARLWIYFFQRSLGLVYNVNLFLREPLKFTKNDLKMGCPDIKLFLYEPILRDFSYKEL